MGYRGRDRGRGHGHGRGRPGWRGCNHSTDVLTLTVAELKQLADEDTILISSIDIVDSVQNIMAEVVSAGLGALGSVTTNSVRQTMVPS